MSIQMYVEFNFSAGLKRRTYNFTISGESLKEIKDKARKLEMEIHEEEYGGHGVEFHPPKYYTEFTQKLD